jgi:Skp family chaperone for outer membrane proteins
MKTRLGIVGTFTKWSVLACLSTCTALFAPPAASAQKPLKIGVVNFQEVALQCKAGKAAKARLEKMADQVKKEVRGKEEKLVARQKELETAASRLTSAERQHRAEALEKDELVIKRLIQDKTEELRKAEADSVVELARQIDPILKAYAAEKGFDLILESRRPGLMYYDQKLDITAEIVKRFDRTSK